MMSAKSVNAILARAMSEPEFAELVFTNPELALAGYELTDEEAKNIINMSRSRLEVVAETFPEDRKSFGWANHNEIGLKINQ